MSARFVDFEAVRARFAGRRVAIVGSAPSVLENAPGYIDSHEVVVRVNNFKTVGPRTGFRTDVHYSFYGSSIRKTAAELRADGVTLCMCKCPDAKPLESPWHEKTGRVRGVDFRPIYKNRRGFWFCDVYVPTVARFLEGFELLGRHIPTTGFSAILEVLACEPFSVYLTGFDFFASGKHNVNERWRPGDPADPIGHVPEREAEILAAIARERVLGLDPTLAACLARASEREAARRA